MHYFCGLKYASENFIRALFYNDNIIFFTYFDFKGVAGDIKSYHKWNQIKKKWIPIERNGFVFNLETNSWHKNL